VTKKLKTRLDRDRNRMPRGDNIASASIDQKNKRIAYTTKDMLVNQLQRDGPRIARSFDRLAKQELAACSAVFGLVQGMLLLHLQRMEDDDFEATAARLLFSASNSLVASIEVARHGYPRQYGAVARVFIETLATVIVLATKEDALVKFHAGQLRSTDCIAPSKEVLPPLGRYWGLLSNEFVHIGREYGNVDCPSEYSQINDALRFITSSMRGNVWLLHVVTDLIFSHETKTPLYWRRNGQEAWFDPNPAMRKWTEEFLDTGTEKPVVPLT
jgi:hypothetical protein